MKTVFDLQLPALLCFVKESCHENLHDTLVDLREMANERGLSHVPEELPSFVKDLIRRIQFHLAMEENDLFPLIEMQKKESNIFPIYSLLDDHDVFDQDLVSLREMTDNYAIDGLCEKGLSLYSKLLELERIILNHIQLENHVLYPLVLKIS